MLVFFLTYGKEDLKSFSLEKNYIFENISAVVIWNGSITMFCCSLTDIPQEQKSRQKVVSRGALRLCCGLDIHSTKIPLIYSVAYFNLGALELCLRGISPPIPNPISPWPRNCIGDAFFLNECLLIESRMNCNDKF